MKKAIPIIIIIASFFTLTACSRSEFMDLGGFVYNFNKVSDEEIELEDVYFYDEGGVRTFETFIEDEVLIKLTMREDKIETVKVAIIKIREKGAIQILSSETLTDFISAAKSSIIAFCGYSREEAENLLNEFGLYDKETYKKEGELTKTKGKNHFVYLSNSLVNEVIIYNTFLFDVPKTEKPESKPLFGKTTNLR